VDRVCKVQWRNACMFSGAMHAVPSWTGCMPMGKATCKPHVCHNTRASVPLVCTKLGIEPKYITCPDTDLHVLGVVLNGKQHDILERADACCPPHRQSRQDWRLASQHVALRKLPVVHSPGQGDGRLSRQQHLPKPMSLRPLSRDASRFNQGSLHGWCAAVE
jgi:hypothetical protein